MAILFAFSIITSHYGTAYAFMLILIVAMILLFLKKKFADQENIFTTPNLCILYIVSAFFWYLYTSGSANLNWAVSFGEHILSNLSEFLQPESSATMRAITSKWPSLSIEITKWLIFIIIFFMSIGVLKLFYDRLKGDKKFSDEYTIFVISFFLLLSILLLPKAIGALRIFAMSLILTAPFAVYGFFTLFKLFHLNSKYYLVIFSLFLFIFLIFGNGLIASVLNIICNETVDYSSHFLLHRQSIQKGSDPEAKSYLYWGYPHDLTIATNEWILRHKELGKKTYVDSPSLNIFLTRRGGEAGASYVSIKYGNKVVYGDMVSPNLALMDDLLNKEIKNSDYILLRYYNVVENMIIIVDNKGEKTFLKTSNYKNIFISKLKIYSNGGGIIYYG